MDLSKISFLHDMAILDWTVWRQVSPEVAAQCSSVVTDTLTEGWRHRRKLRRSSRNCSPLFVRVASPKGRSIMSALWALYLLSLIFKLKRFTTFRQVKVRFPSKFNSTKITQSADVEKTFQVQDFRRCREWDRWNFDIKPEIRSSWTRY